MVRWHRPGRTILNAYGPTEATVTATLTELHPDKPVTIGGPLPTYSIVILDPHKDEALSPGEMGEIGIAGIGLAAGYLNRDDLTQKKFIPDFLHIPNNPSGRIYRTGDLGRINEQDEVEFHGRIDTQVKIRGYRIELTEIELVLLELPQIAQAAVITHESEPGMVELAAYYSLKQGVIGAAARRGVGGAAQPAAGLHGAGLSGAPADHPDDGLQQGRPQEAARPQGPAVLGRRRQVRGPARRDRDDPGAARWPRCSSSSGCRPRTTSSRIWARIRC